ncbi:dicarboxylate/amino acid:cation symporter [Fodinisporobacter ferrooxydans]|uniref:Dicarboxylate/amino acid:cation symporter n=1 Tax=Fodinisporobacter ferrooxydans TaxID=2901836 RepID=A0ABY4CGK6_9BACL|nr:dicarboxylate/amino acid:cation symporter [Alicyclobacillaceae bacterium MYW30-H2]
MLRKIPLGIQILIAMILGIVVGGASKTFGIHLKILGDAFIHLIQMAILPLVFPLIVLGISQMQSIRRIGRIAGKTILYFEVITTIVLFIGIFLADATQVGSGVNLAGAKGNLLHGIAKGIDFQAFVLNMIPHNLFASLTQGNLLSLVFFALFFGLGMAAVAEKAKPVEQFLESVANIMFQVLDFIIRFAPIGVFGFIAFDIANYGWASIWLLGQFVGIAYLGFLIIVFLLLPLAALVFKVSYIKLLREIWDLILLAFTSRSSEIVLAPLLERLKGYGVDESIGSFVLPVGYSFNLDGATLYESIAVLFLAHAYGIQLTFVHQLEIIGVLMVLTKGLAGVPSAAIVILLSTAKSIGIPLEGVALLLGIDFIIDMGRTAVNVVGNSLAAVIVAKSEKLFQPKASLQ